MPRDRVRGDSELQKEINRRDYNRAVEDIFNAIVDKVSDMSDFNLTQKDFDRAVAEAAKRYVETEG